MADGRFRRDYRGRSPPRHDRFPNDRRPNWSPPRNRRKDEFDRRDNSGHGFGGRDGFGRDLERRKSRELKFDGPLLNENQFNDASQYRGMSYEAYKAQHKRFNAKSFFMAHRTDTRFIERYNPTSIVERRKRDAAESQNLAKQFLTIIDEESFTLPNYDADAHEDLFPEFVMEVEEPVKVIEIDENNNRKEEKLDTITEDKPESNEEKKEGETSNEKTTEEIKDEAREQLEYKKKKKAFQDSLPQLLPISSHDRITKDLELIQKLTSHFDQMRSINSNPLLGKFQSSQPTPTEASNTTQGETEASATTTTTTAPTEQELAEEAKINQYHEKFIAYSEKQQLDLFIYYLLTVHFHAYYTCITFPSADKDKVKAVYRGSEKHNPELENSAFSSNWGESLDKKIQERLNLDLTVASGEKKCDEFLEIFYSEKVIKESAERFRCDICTKMFKGPIFVRKHIVAKHSDKIEEIKEKALEEQFFLNYLSHCEKAQEQATEKSERTPPKDMKPRIDKDKDLRERVRDPPTDLRRRSRSPPPLRNDNNFNNNKRPRSPPRRGGPWEGDDRRQMSARGGRGGFEAWNGRGTGIRGRGKFLRTEFDHPPELREKMDPRAKFVDLDKPQENSFEIDYEKALAAFEQGDDA